MSANTALNEKRKRPFGLLAIIILQLIQALTWGALIYGLNTPQFAETTAELLTISTAYYLQMGSTLLFIVALPGLWFFKRWGWILLMIQLGVSLSAGLWQFAEGAPNYIAMILNVTIVFYLNQRDVQQLFAKDEVNAQ